MFSAGSFLLVALVMAGVIYFKVYDRFYMYIIKLLILFSIFIQIGYFINIGGQLISYTEILMALAILMGIPLIKKEKIYFKSLFTVIALLLSILIGYILVENLLIESLILPIGGSWDRYLWGEELLTVATFNFSHIKSFVRLLIFFALYYVLDKHVFKNEERSDELKKFIVNSGLFFAFICVIEQITKVFGSSVFLDISRSFFGKGGSQIEFVFERAGVFALQGLTAEPSHLVLSYIPVVLVLMTSNIISDKKKLFTLLVVLYVFLSSGSFGGFALSGLFILMYIFSSSNRLFIKAALMGTILSGVTILVINSPKLSLLFEYYYARAVLTLNYGGIGTGSARLNSISVGFENFKENPLLGVGFGTTDIHGFIPSLLVSFGLIGTMIWVLIVFKGFEASKLANKRFLIILIPFMFMIGSVSMIYSMHLLLVALLVFREYKEVTAPQQRFFSNLKSV